jgi:hypothetical protein
VSEAERPTTRRHVVPLIHHLVHQYTKYRLVSEGIVASCNGTRKTLDLA